MPRDHFDSLVGEMIWINVTIPGAIEIFAMRNHYLARDVVVVVAIKAALVVAAATFLFGPHQRPRIDAGSVATRLIGPPPSIAK